MVNKITNIKDRIIYFIENQKIKKSEFFDKIGMTSANFRGNAKESPLNSATIENIISLYPAVNTDWLITGKGEMLKPDITNVINVTYKGIPLLTESAFAGITSGDVSILELDCERYVIPTFKGADFLITVKGSSMNPKYSSGDIVACKWLPLDTFFQWNKVYVLDTIQGPLIKRIKKGKDEDHLLIISENERYEPYDLHRNEIRKLALVIGVIRLE